MNSIQTSEANAETQPKEEENTIDGEQEDSPKKAFPWVKVILGLLLLGFIIFVIVDSVTNGYVRDGIDSFLDWIEENSVAGIFCFMGVYFVATVLFIPGSILTLGSGFVFASAFGLGAGLAVGVLAVFVGASLGATVSFLLGRYLLRDQAQRLTRKYAVFEALDIALQENGLKILFLLRLSPIIPFNAINYICGVTAVSLRDYVISLLGILPGTTLYVFLGASAGSLADSASSGDDTTVTIAVVVVGVVLGVVAVFLSARYAKKELNKITQQREAESANDVENPSEGPEPEHEDGNIDKPNETERDDDDQIDLDATVSV